MEVALFGYGYMGRLIDRFLRKEKRVSQIYIIDPAPKEKLPADVSIYPCLQALPKTARIKAAFVAASCVNHFDILQQVIQAGIRNIFCEKPMCLTQKEYRDLKAITPPDAKIIVDYILRSSPALTRFQQQVADLQAQGFQVKRCHVVYGKDMTQDNRRFRDMGIYEDLYHVWDLCFNRGGIFGDVRQVTPLKKICYPDLEVKNRCVAQRFTALVETAQQQKCFLNVYADFAWPRKQRGFVFYLYKGQEKQTVSLLFDQQGQDKCIHVDSQGQTHVSAFPSHQKLGREITDVLTYFESGQRAPYFHDAEDSLRLADIMERLHQTVPLQKNVLTQHVSCHNNKRLSCREDYEK